METPELNAGLKKHRDGDFYEAEMIYRKILQKEPDNHNAWHLLGLIAHQAGKYEEAVKCISKAIALSPNHAVYYGNLGMSYDALKKEQESADAFGKALAISPDYENAHLAHHNLGVYFAGKGEYSRALEHYNKAVELKKDFYDAVWNRGIILLLLGDFEQGWKDYEARFKKQSPTDSRKFKIPRWDGSSLNNKKIIVIAEQGFGDCIQFARYLPMIKEAGGSIVLECKKELKRLFEKICCIDGIIEKGEDISGLECDFYIHLMSLPRVFGTNSEKDIPNKVPYLKADPRLAEKFKSKLKAEEGKIKVGIVWSGNKKQESDENRSARFLDFIPLKAIKEIKLFSLQKGPASAQLNKDADVIDMSSEIENFADTAAIIENLDLVITVDTSVAHLAGAMAKKTFVLLASDADWRFMLKRNDCPWYPTMKLLRQERAGDWASVIGQVLEEVRTNL